MNSKICFGLTCPAVCFWDAAEHRIAPEFQDILTKEFRKELLDKLGASFFLGSAIYDQIGISLNYENLKGQMDDELIEALKKDLNNFIYEPAHEETIEKDDILVSDALKVIFEKYDKDLYFTLFRSTADTETCFFGWDLNQDNPNFEVEKTAILYRFFNLEDVKWIHLGFIKI